MFCRLCNSCHCKQYRLKRKYAMGAGQPAGDAGCGRVATAAAAQPRAKAEAAAAPAAAAAAAAAQLEQAAAAAHRLLTHQEYSAPATPVTQARALLSLLLQSPATATTAQHLHTPPGCRRCWLYAAHARGPNLPASLADAHCTADVVLCCCLLGAGGCHRRAQLRPRLSLGGSPSGGGRCRDIRRGSGTATVLPGISSRPAAAEAA